MRRALSILLILFASAAVLVIGVLAATLLASRDALYLSAEDAPEAPVAIVFGAGLRRDGRPSDVLHDRLATAAELLKLGKVRRILVSGDNRFEAYNEPQAMYDALVTDFGVHPGDVAVDYAGRRTYDTCIRARTIWGVEEAILVTQAYHLPRALWTCARLGVDGAGVSASRREYVKGTSFLLREGPAILQAWWDVYAVRPPYVASEFEEDLGS